MTNTQKAGMALLLFLVLAFILTINEFLRLKAENQDLIRADFKVA